MIERQGRRDREKMGKSEGRNETERKIVRKKLEIQRETKREIEREREGVRKKERERERYRKSEREIKR